MNMNIFSGKAWGLPISAVEELADKLREFWGRFQGCFRTKTRDSSEYAYDYLSGQLRMETGRNFAGISRETFASEQNLQHFMSNSPWSAQIVYAQVQEEIKNTPGLQTGGVLILDESADEKAGSFSAGAGRQYNGRMGKVDMSQVGVFLAYANLTTHPLWTWIEGDLFLQEAWFDDAHADLYKNLDIPSFLSFKTKPEIGWEMILRVKNRGLPFEIMACDCLYGRSGWLRSKMREEDILYMAEIPSDTQVYLKKPILGVPSPKPGKGRPPSKAQILSTETPVRVDSLRNAQETVWKTVYVRNIERGELRDPFAARRVWTIYEDKVVEEWLVMRRESDGRHSYALSNASADTTLEQLAWWKCQRYFVERANQDAKSELGWNELQARKYRAWEHHLALTILSTWFLMQTKFEWAQTYERDPRLMTELETDVLPALSIANLRLLLRAIMPLRQFTKEQAVALVLDFLFKRICSRKSKMKNNGQPVPDG